MTTREQRIAAIEKDWAENPRWAGIKRGYTAADVERLRGSFPVEYTLARRGAEKLWNLVNNEPYINCLGALTGAAVGSEMDEMEARNRALIEQKMGRQVAAGALTVNEARPREERRPGSGGDRGGFGGGRRPGGSGGYGNDRRGGTGGGGGRRDW